MSNNECIFCKIIKENSAAVFLENEHAIAIPDLHPITQGHTLIITKKHFENYMECETEDLKSASVLARDTAKQLLLNHPDIAGFNYVSNQNAIAKQVIFHLHIHVIPRYKK